MRPGKANSLTLIFRTAMGSGHANILNKQRSNSPVLLVGPSYAIHVCGW
jgi:hypothetical protein